MKSVPWSIPPDLFAGRTVAVLASGPSMSAAVADAVRAAGAAAIAVNNTFRLAPWAEMLYAADQEWWQHWSNRDAHQFAGLKVACTPQAGVNILRFAGAEGYTDELDCVHTYHNSGAQAIQIAVKGGAAKVLLCGMDMKGDSHWHGRHVEGLRHTNPEHYPRWVEKMRTLAAVLKPLCDVVNCTPGSALEGFRRARLEDELETACLVQ